MERQLYVYISGNENNLITIEKICYTKKNACILYISHLCIDYVQEKRGTRITAMYFKLLRSFSMSERKKSY